MGCNFQALKCCDINIVWDEETIQHLLSSWNPNYCCLFLFHFNMFLMWWLLFPPHNLSLSSSTITYAINLLYTRISSCWSTYYSVITLTFSTLHFPRHLPSSIIHSFPFSSASSLVWLRCACRTVYPLSSTSSGMERKSGRGEFSKSLKNNIIFQF